MPLGACLEGFLLAILPIVMAGLLIAWQFVTSTFALFLPGKEIILLNVVIPPPPQNEDGQIYVNLESILLSL